MKKLLIIIITTLTYNTTPLSSYRKNKKAPTPQEQAIRADQEQLTTAHNAAYGKPLLIAHPTPSELLDRVKNLALKNITHTTQPAQAALSQIIEELPRCITQLNTRYQSWHNNNAIIIPATININSELTTINNIITQLTDRYNFLRFCGQNLYHQKLTPRPYKRALETSIITTKHAHTKLIEELKKIQTELLTKSNTATPLLHPTQRHQRSTLSYYEQTRIMQNYHHALKQTPKTPTEKTAIQNTLETARPIITTRRNQATTCQAWLQQQQHLNTLNAKLSSLL